MTFLIHSMAQRKEKLLKKQHRQALLLDSMIVDGFGSGRSLRGRKPVSYTFGKINDVVFNFLSYMCFLL